MIIRFIENIGDKTIRFASSFYEAIAFSINYFFYLFKLKNYTSNFFQIFIQQTYYGSLKAIPSFLFIALVFGFIIIGIVISLAAKYNMQLHIATILVNFIFNEFSTFFTMLYLYFRFKLSLNTQEIEFDENTKSALLLSISLSSVMLGTLFSITMILSGFIAASFIMGVDLYTYKVIIFDAIEISNIFILIIKSLIFGFVVSLVLLANATKGIKNSMLVLLVSIFFIEIMSVALLTLLT